MVKIFLTSFYIMVCAFSFSQEICNNGIDDDSDGLIDLNDPDCDCDGFGTPQTIPSLIPNPSFEEKNCCPTSFSQLNCASTWIQATDATSDYFNCSYSLGAATNAGITPPTGTGYVGAIYQNGWKEYIGACLLAPLVAGESYTLSFKIASFPVGGSGQVCTGLNYGDIDVSIFGTSSCSNLPVATSDCPADASPNWNLIGTATYSPLSSWGTIEIEMDPTSDINAIMIGPPCGTLPAGYQGNPCFAYFVYDDLILASNIFFNSVDIDETGNLCNDDLQLEASTDSIGGAWQWYKDGIALVGETNTVLDISSNNYTPGDYQARYTLGNKCDIAEHIIDPPQYPVADFDFPTVCENLATAFTNQSTFPLNGIVDWEWDYDDDQIFDDTGTSTLHTFPSDGYFDVALRVTDSLGCQNEVTQSVEVYSNPVADFKIDSVCLETNSSIQDLSSINTTNGNSISSWAWDFGDGQLVTDQNPPGHLYADENIYDVELIVVSNNGCSDTIIKTTAIYPNPVVSFSVPDVCSLSPAEFSDASTVSTAHSSNQINDWAWDFGDGNTDDVQNPVHTYAIDSVYNAVLTITTDHNCSAKDSVTVTVFPKPKAKFLNDSLCLGGNSVFQDLSSINSSNGDQIIDWSWDFDDDSVSNTQNPDHTYLTPGNYNTELIVTSDFGCKDTANGTVIVHANPTFSLDIALPNCGQGDGEIVITPNAGDYPYGYSIDNGTNIQNDSTFINLFPGPYHIVVADSNGCISSMDATLSTSDPISSTFTFANFCEGNNNEPIDLSLPNGVFSFVTPPTGGATIDPSTGVISNGVGGTTYTVQYVNSGATCSDTAFANVTVYTMPIVDFEGDTTQGMPPLLINFTNNSFGADNYTWGFGDGSNEQNNDVQVPHTFYDEGTFTTLLTGKSGNGLCVDTASIKIIVFYPEIVYKFPNVFTPNGDNSNDNFKFVYHKHIKSLHIVILNRWGNPLFESNKMDFHWNGKINNSGEECVDGTYFYKADLKSYKAEEIQEHGFIQLSRGK